MHWSEYISILCAGCVLDSIRINRRRESTQAHRHTHNSHTHTTLHSLLIALLGLAFLIVDNGDTCQLLRLVILLRILGRHLQRRPNVHRQSTRRRRCVCVGHTYVCVRIVCVEYMGQLGVGYCLRTHRLLPLASFARASKLDLNDQLSHTHAQVSRDLHPCTRWCAGFSATTEQEGKTKNEVALPGAFSPPAKTAMLQKGDVRSLRS